MLVTQYPSLTRSLPGISNLRRLLATWINSSADVIDGGRRTSTVGPFLPDDMVPTSGRIGHEDRLSAIYCTSEKSVR